MQTNLGKVFIAHLFELFLLTIILTLNDFCVDIFTVAFIIIIIRKLWHLVKNINRISLWPNLTIHQRNNIKAHGLIFEASGREMRLKEGVEMQILDLPRIFETPYGKKTSGMPDRIIDCNQSNKCTQKRLCQLESS